MNNNNVATEITCFQKNMVALENQPSSENLVHPTPYPLLHLLNLVPKPYFFFSPDPFAGE